MVDEREFYMEGYLQSKVKRQKSKWFQRDGVKPNEFSDMIFLFVFIFVFIVFHFCFFACSLPQSRACPFQFAPIPTTHCIPSPKNIWVLKFVTCEGSRIWVWQLLTFVKWCFYVRHYVNYLQTHDPYNILNKVLLFPIYERENWVWERLSL